MESNQDVVSVLSFFDKLANDVERSPGRYDLPQSVVPILAAYLDRSADDLQVQKLGAGSLSTHQAVMARTAAKALKPHEAQVGDIVRYTGKFLRNIGMQVGGPVNGRVVSIKAGGFMDGWPRIEWSDGGDMMVNPINVEFDPRQRRAKKLSPEFLKNIKKEDGDGDGKINEKSEKPDWLADKIKGKDKKSAVFAHIEVEARFEEGKPVDVAKELRQDGNQQDAKKWEKSNDKYDDKFKGKGKGKGDKKKTSNEVHIAFVMSDPQEFLDEMSRVAMNLSRNQNEAYTLIRGAENHPWKKIRSILADLRAPKIQRDQWANLRVKYNVSGRTVNGLVRWDKGSTWFELEGGKMLLNQPRQAVEMIVAVLLPSTQSDNPTTRLRKRSR